MLSQLSNRGVDDPSHPSSHTKYRYLPSPVKNERLHRLHSLIRVSPKRVTRLQEKLDAITHAQGVDVDKAIHNYCITTHVHVYTHLYAG